MHPFCSLLEDIDWLRSAWLLGDSDRLSDADIRRGSTQLHLLLAQGLLQKAWMHYGLEKQPRISGPDIAALAKEKGLRLDLVGSLVAGGGLIEGVSASLIGGFRVNNPST